MAEGCAHPSFMGTIFQLPAELRSKALGCLYNGIVSCLLGVSEGAQARKEGWDWETSWQFWVGGGRGRNPEEDETSAPLTRADAFDFRDLSGGEVCGEDVQRQLKLCRKTLAGTSQPVASAWN